MVWRKAAMPSQITRPYKVFVTIKGFIKRDYVLKIDSERVL